MQQSPISSFLKFLIGFLTLISVSFGVTYAVNTIAQSQDASQSASAAKALMLKVGE
ncbi:hypothetical protein HY970_03430 [Candidatus Kaiserbacteria bacterium]|nr:hypothetical protein [Candidatus Kaiserbacteria bacterium]